LTLRGRRIAIAGATAAVLVGAAAVGFALGRGEDERAPVIAASYPEGPLVRGNTVYFAEMGADRVSVVDGRKVRPFFVQRGCGPTAIAPYASDGYLVLCHLGRRLVAVSPTGQETRRWDVAGGRPLMGPNDAHADGSGGVYVSDPGLFSRHTEPHGRVLHLAPDGALRVVAEPLWYPNGIYVDARQRLYISEHLAGRVLRFDINPDRSLGPPVTFARLADVEPSKRYRTPYAETGPDGLEMGANSELYVVVYGEGRVVRFSASGAYRGVVVELPTRYATNISFFRDGRAVTTGAFTNTDAPFPGEVRLHTAEALRRDRARR
jgi:gluconolactonase